MEASRRETAPTPSGLILTTRYGSQSGELMPSCALIRQTFPSNRANSNVRQRNGNRRPSIGRDARIFKLDLAGARPQAERVRPDERPQEGQRRQPFVRSILRNHDIWLTPTMGALPLLLGYLDSSSSDVGLLMTRFSELYRFNPVYNASGLPAMTLPLHFSRSGLPIGMMFGAGFGKEAIPVSSSRATGACDAMDRSPPSQSLDVTANRRRMGAIVSGPRLPRALLFATGKHPRASHHSSADRRNHPFRDRTIGRVRAQSAVMPPNQPAP